MEEVIAKNWLMGNGWGLDDGSDLSSGSDWGDGSGEDSICGSGEDSGKGGGYGSGAGEGESEGEGYGCGCGAIVGAGEDSVECYGCGWGAGEGESEGEGAGDGSGAIIKSYNGNPVFYVDGIPTIITSIHGNYAKGKIIHNDSYETDDCFIAKSEDSRFFAHGKTLRDATGALSEKIQDSISDDDRISKFCELLKKAKNISVRSFINGIIS